MNKGKAVPHFSQEPPGRLGVYMPGSHLGMALGMSLRCHPEPRLVATTAHRVDFSIRPTAIAKRCPLTNITHLFLFGQSRSAPIPVRRFRRTPTCSSTRSNRTRPLHPCLKKKSMFISLRHQGVRKFIYLVPYNTQPGRMIRGHPPNFITTISLSKIPASNPVLFRLASSRVLQFSPLYDAIELCVV